MTLIREHPIAKIWATTLASNFDFQFRLSIKNLPMDRSRLASFHPFERHIANSRKHMRDQDAQDDEETILGELTHFRLLRYPNLQLDHLVLTPSVDREYLPLRPT